MSLKSITRRLFGLTAIDSLEIKDWYIDGEKVTATAAQLNNITPATVVPASLAADVVIGNLKGANGSAMRVKTNIYKFQIENGTAPGVNVSWSGRAEDRLVAVLLIEFGAGVFDRTSEYTPGNLTLIKTAGSNDAGKTLYIYWLDKNSGAET